jgi:8-oxo-dGTP diphosphatase
LSESIVAENHFPTVGVGVVILNEADEVLLVQRGTEPNIGMWTIPGGRQKPGETLIETARREIYEETGVQISIPKLIDVVDLIRHDDNGTLLRHYALIDYTARHISGDPRPGGDAAAVAWVPTAEIEDHISWTETLRIIHEAISMLRDSD